MNLLTLRHQNQITVRRIRPEDVDLVFEMHKRLLPMSIYNRYLRGYVPRRGAISDMCRIDEADGEAFVATVLNPGERIIGMAYYIINADDPLRETAEPALLVEDRFQMQGVGSFLARYMTDQAQMRGINTFKALISASNQGVFRILQRSGLDFTSQYAYGTREICIYLNQASTFSEAADERKEKAV